MVLATTRLGHARRQSALYYARARRRSLLSDARLFGNFSLSEGGSIAIGGGAAFPDTLTPVTFEGVARFEAAGAAGETLFDTGAIAIVTTATGLQIVAAGFSADVVLSPGQRFRWNLAIRPGDAQVRFWVDSVRRVADTLGTAPFAWHPGASTLTYDDTARVTVLAPLLVFYQQRPRHFGDAVGVPITTTNDILFRAAIATFLTGAFPFVDNPTDTP